MNDYDWVSGDFNWEPNVPSDLSGGSSSMVDSSGNVMQGMNWGSIASAGGSVLSAYGSILAGKQASQAYEYNAALTRSVAGFELGQLEEDEDSMLGSQRAVYGKSGIAFTGSALDAAVHTASKFELNKQILKYNSESRANMMQYEGDMAKAQGKIKAGQQLLQGGLSAFAGMVGG